jgi:phosphonate degradation associated HDIG domain protein
MALTVREIIELYETRGAAQYGSEAVNQLAHALQCATLAEEAGAAPELVAASFLHDLGHLLAVIPHEIGRESDDQHEYRALPSLRGVFDNAVLQPIRLHVDAKRFLCFAEPGYWNSLSPASKHSLQLQGGVFTAIEAERFIARQFALDAVKLRCWDDRAKCPGRATRTLGDMAALLSDLSRVGARLLVTGL